MAYQRNERRAHIRERVRRKVSGTDARPRLSVFRSNVDIYAQIISDEAGRTLVSASSLKDKKAHGAAGVEQARLVGTASPRRPRALHEVASPKLEAEARPAPTFSAKPPKPDRGFTIEGVGNLLTQLARCCQPVAGDLIVGYLTQGRGVSVHRQDCEEMQHLAARYPERVLPVEWGRKGAQSYRVDVLVRGFDRQWLLKDLTNVIGVANAHILGANSRMDDASGRVELRFTLKVNDFQQLGDLLGKMSAVPGVNEARRTH